ncbi:hypothetical protein GCM10023188_13660 [Pontibacter saemangeumensis]|uniref:CAAX prenyl protease 2/Lysostaphin resistance protein A-like domain-containing protein n=1 Tax=Pontibacter saemangeumensis TaxID=1084525 RepID=A0ABP8LH90_9BACT
MVGFGIYAVKYLISYALGKFEVAGTMDTAFIFMLLAQALLAMFFSSAINEVVIRGYWLAYLREKHLLTWFLPVVTVLYILDDCWNAGFHAENVVFSAILGFTFAYAVLKTGNLWLSIGLHWGGNVMYRMLYGFNGQGVWRLENIADQPFYDYISLTVTALMFPVVYRLLKSRLIYVDAPADAKQEPLSAGTARLT